MIYVDRTRVKPLARLKALRERELAKLREFYHYWRQRDTKRKKKIVQIDVYGTEGRDVASR